MRFQKGFTPIYIILLAVILIAALGFYFFKVYKQDYLYTPSDSPIRPSSENLSTDDPRYILKSLQKDLGVNSPITWQPHEEFYDDKKMRIPLRGWIFSLATIATDYAAKYGDYKVDDLNFVSEKDVLKIGDKAEKSFISLGFEKNTDNTLTTHDPYHFITLGFTRGDLKCLVYLLPQSDPFTDFFCGTVDQTQVDWRKEFESVINPKKDPKIIVTIDEVNDELVVGSVGMARGVGGGVWYAVKVDGKWKKVWEGQEMISCKESNKYEALKKFIGEDCLKD